MINHHSAKISKLRNNDDCTCTIELSARQDEDYFKIWRGMTRRGCLELKAWHSDYGMTGRFICPSEQLARRFFREIKMGPDEDQTPGEMGKRNFKAIYRRTASAKGFADAIHTKWEMCLQLFVKIK